VILGQITVVLAIVVAGVWGGTQYAAVQLGFSS
jgi:hypothetical protein